MSVSMSLEEKQVLAAHINGMDAEQLKGVVDILMRRVPALQENAGTEVQLDIDKLDDETLKEMELYVEKIRLGGPVAAAAAQAAAVGTPMQDVPNDAEAAAARVAEGEAQAAAADAAVAAIAAGRPAGGSALPPAKKQKSSTGSSASAEEKDQLRREVLAGAERVLRQAGKPLQAVEVLRDGLRGGHFRGLWASANAQTALKMELNAEIKKNKRAPFTFAKKEGVYGLKEFQVVDPVARQETRQGFEEQLAASGVPAPDPSAAPSPDEVGLKCFAPMIMVAMSRKKDHWIFASPVDPVALNIPDYFTVITTPMDLGTVSSRLESNQYDTVDAWAADVRLVFANAIKYNGLKTSVGQLAESYGQVFEREYAFFFGDAAEGAAQPPADAAAAPASGDTATMPQTEVKAEPAASEVKSEQQSSAPAETVHTEPAQAAPAPEAPSTTAPEPNQQQQEQQQQQQQQQQQPQTEANATTEAEPMKTEQPEEQQTPAAAPVTAQQQQSQQEQQPLTSSVPGNDVPASASAVPAPSAPDSTAPAAAAAPAPQDVEMKDA